MPRFTEPRVAYSSAEYVIFPALKFDPHKKKCLAFDTVNYLFGREGALLASRLTEMIFLPLLSLSISAIIPCLGMQMGTSPPPSPAQSISPATPAPPTPSQTMHGAVAAVPTAAERKARRKARKRRERGVGVQVSAMRC